MSRHRHTQASPNAANDADDYADTRRFLARLGRTRFTFQTYDDKERDRPGGMKHGTLDDHLQYLERRNAKQNAVTVMINEGDGKGRKAQNVANVTALFVDLDGAPLGPVDA